MMLPNTPLYSQVSKWVIKSGKHALPSSRKGGGDLKMMDRKGD